MYLNYVNASFKNLTPSNINKSVKEIRSSSIYKSRVKIKQEYRDLVIVAIEKISNNEELDPYDYRILIYNLDTVQKQGYLDVFINIVIANIGNIRNNELYIRPILSYIYNNENVEECDELYELLKELAKVIKAKDKYKTIIRTIRRYDTLEDYLIFIQNKIIKAKNEDILDDFKNIYLIKSTDEFYIKCMYHYVLKNITIEEQMDRNIEIINSMPYIRRIEILKEALEKSKGRYKHLKIKWIEKMGSILNHPYNGSNSNWNDFNEEYIEKYILYYNESLLNKAFNNGQEDKKEFFMKYSKEIYNIEYFENFRKALVMEFKNHTLISIGNVLYIYSKNIYNIHKLKEMLEVNKKSECNAMLKDEKYLKASLNYKKQWQDIFTEELLIRGYKGER